MPRKAQGWITFQSSEEERQILEQICQKTQRTKTEILREMIRQMGTSPASESVEVGTIQFSDDGDNDGDNESDSEGDSEVTDSTAPSSPAALQSIQISARNVLQATVKRVVKGSVNAEVTLEIVPGVELVSIVTRTSADRMGLKKGKLVFAIIKSNSVMIAAGS